MLTPWRQKQRLMVAANPDGIEPVVEEDYVLLDNGVDHIVRCLKCSRTAPAWQASSVHGHVPADRLSTEHLWQRALLTAGMMKTTTPDASHKAWPESIEFNQTTLQQNLNVATAIHFSPAQQRKETV